MAKTPNPDLHLPRSAYRDEWYQSEGEKRDLSDADKAYCADMASKLGITPKKEARAGGSGRPFRGSRR